MEKFPLPKCELWHPEDEPPEAVDFIVQAFQNDEGHTIHIQIPVCATCMDYLERGVLKLNFCYGCSSSQWRINNDPSKNHEIRWFDKCEHCR